MDQPPKKKPTSLDVAALAGVSQSSVSQILSGSSRASFSEETRVRVLTVAKELGYHPPVHRASKEKKPILVLIPTLMNPYYTEIVQTLEQQVEMLGYRILLCNTFRKKELEKFYLEQFVGPKITGIIYTFLPHNPEMLQSIAKATPVVLIGEKTSNMPICSVELNHYHAGALLADHLYDLGHRHIAFLSTPMDQISLSRKQRCEGLRKQLTLRGNQDHCLVSVDTFASSMDKEFDSGLGNVPYEFHVGNELAKHVLTSTAATAFVAANDMIALGIQSALTEMGHKVPESYSVCGFDNIFYSQMQHPTLTTIDHRMLARCRSAVNTLLEQSRYGSYGVDNDIAANKIEYMPQLIVRGSTGSVRKETL